eukprot:8978130-Pyramimonas_sp.AAC.1
MGAERKQSNASYYMSSRSEQQYLRFVRGGAPFYRAMAGCVSHGMKCNSGLTRRGTKMNGWPGIQLLDGEVQHADGALGLGSARRRA